MLLIFSCWWYVIHTILQTNIQSWQDFAKFVREFRVFFFFFFFTNFGEYITKHIGGIVRVSLNLTSSLKFKP